MSLKAMNNKKNKTLFSIQQLRRHLEFKLMFGINFAQILFKNKVVFSQAFHRNEDKFSLKVKKSVVLSSLSPIH